MTFRRIRHSRSRLGVNVIARVAGDIVQFVLSILRPRGRLAAENLFLRKQLMLYLEKQVKPRRADDATRLTLVALSRLIDWRPLLTVVVLEVGTRRILHWIVTDHPTAAWTTQQFRMVVSGDELHRFVVHDHDSIYSDGVDHAITAMGLALTTIGDGRTPVSGRESRIRPRIGSRHRPAVTESAMATVSSPNRCSVADTTNIVLSPLPRDPTSEHVDRFAEHSLVA